MVQAKAGFCCLAARSTKIDIRFSSYSDRHENGNSYFPIGKLRAEYLDVSWKIYRLLEI